MSIFALSEYVISPKLKTLEEPLMDVIMLDNIPPVQDSAVVTDAFLCSSALPSWLDSSNNSFLMGKV